MSMYFSLFGLRYTSDLEGEYIDDFEDQSWLIGWQNWLLIY